MCCIGSTLKHSNVNRANKQERPLAMTRSNHQMGVERTKTTTHAFYYYSQIDVDVDRNQES